MKNLAFAIIVALALAGCTSPAANPSSRNPSYCLTHPDKCN